MEQLIACMPNFSEGRDQEKINAIAEEIRKIEDVKLLDVSSNRDHNRAVITFGGGLSGIRKAAFASIAKATELIDMAYHRGGHPRLGATDVVPFVPLRGVSMEDCVRIAREVGRDVGEKLGVPVYLYTEAATSIERRSLQAIRKGQYEALPAKLSQESWRPDFGPPEFNPKTGATIVGARGFVIAYNVNLKSRDSELAQKIAELIRDSGSMETDQGIRFKVPGVLPFIKAIGVNLEEFGLVQVSMNVMNYNALPMHIAYETIKRIAALCKVEIHSSEIVGVVPEEALVISGKFYSPDTQEVAELIRVARKHLKLDQFEKFEPEKKIIEWMMEE